MRVHYIALAIATLVASADATSMGAKTEIATPEFSVNQRYLRSHKTATTNGDDEERGLFGWQLLDDAIENMMLSSKIKELLKKRPTADKAYEALNVKSVNTNLFESQQWNDWATYVRKANPKDPDESIAAGMSVVYGVDRFSDMLAAASKDTKTVEIATKLENAQVNRWIVGGWGPENIFKTLNLDKNVDDIFNSPQYATWTRYLKAYTTKHPTEKVDEAQIFISAYGEFKFVKLLSSADDAVSPVTQKFKEEVIQKWLELTTPPNDVFKQLKLDKVGIDDILSSPLLSTWVQYMNQFNEKIPRKKTTMIGIFTMHYGDEALAKMLEAAKKVPETKQLAKNLQTAQFNQWMADEKTPKAVLESVLKLDDQSFTNNAAGDIWRAYNKAYAKNFPETGFAFQP
uniref:RxLR effector protein n=1 Tax=Phytophthora agathidicida TaxID=1642459 RepID=A0A7G4WI37_9STRA|nr:PaRXLR48 [Phytophthora agathidicida]